jgi:Na+-driven multidrug efflux pump
MISFVMRAAFTFVDTAFAATIGDDAVAAIGLVVPIEFVMIAVWVGVSTGFTSCLSKAMGAREGEKITQYTSAAWKLILILAPWFLLIGLAIWYFGDRLGA